MPRNSRLTSCLAIFLCLLVVTCHAAAKQPTSDEMTIAAIMKNGLFTKQKREQVARLMTGRYYGMRVDRRYRSDGRDVVFTEYAGDTADRMQTLATAPTGAGKLADVRVWLWREPSATVTKAAESRTKRVIQQIYNEIAAISTTRDGLATYPELALFDKDHVKVMDQSLSFQPNKESQGSKVSMPYIGVTIHEPSLGAEAQASLPSLLFPLQKVQLTWIVYVEDEALKNRIISIVNSAAQPMTDAEQALGGAAIRANL